MTSKLRNIRGLGIAAALIAGLALSACANKQATDSLASAGSATPGSQQDFVVNVGDRVFFESDSTELTSQSLAGHRVHLSWPATATGFVLEQANALGAVVNWSPVAQTPVFTGGQLAVTLDTSAGNKFFRVC